MGLLGPASATQRTTDLSSNVNKPCGQFIFRIFSCKFGHVTTKVRGPGTLEAHHTVGDEVGVKLRSRAYLKPKSSSILQSHKEEAEKEVAEEDEGEEEKGWGSHTLNPQPLTLKPGRCG
jgi:hypothetical protein